MQGFIILAIPGIEKHTLVFYIARQTDGWNDERFGQPLNNVVLARTRLREGHKSILYNG